MPTSVPKVPARWATQTTLLAEPLDDETQGALRARFGDALTLYSDDVNEDEDDEE